jgi:hypothetical protein
VSSKPDGHGEDAATLLAALATRLSAGVRDGGTFGIGSALLHQSADNNSILQLTVIRKTRVGWWDSLNHPWHARRLVQFQKQFAARGAADVTPAELASVFAAAAMIRYGIAVDHRQYRVLRGLIVDRKIDERRLRRLITFPTIWWGTAVRSSRDDGPFRRFLKWLWTMGRPPAGKLMVARFHWGTRMCLGMFSAATIGVLVYTAYAVVVTLVKHGPAPEAAVFSYAVSQLALLAAGLLWLGPYADHAARRVSALMHDAEASSLSLS